MSFWEIFRQVSGCTKHKEEADWRHTLDEVGAITRQTPEHPVGCARGHKEQQWPRAAQDTTTAIKC